MAHNESMEQISDSKYSHTDSNRMQPLASHYAIRDNRKRFGLLLFRDRHTQIVAMDSTTICSASRRQPSTNPSPNAATMSPELAQQLHSEGAILIVAGCPVGTEFGIDLSAYHIDERFRGIKMIPPGPHYVYTASGGGTGATGGGIGGGTTFGSDSALRVGFLHFFQPREIIIRQWNAEHEELRERLADSGATADETAAQRSVEQGRIRANLKELDR